MDSKKNIILLQCTLYMAKNHQLAAMHIIYGKEPSACGNVQNRIEPTLFKVVNNIDHHSYTQFSPIILFDIGNYEECGQHNI